ncbi:hypothetical protein [Chroococcidiopsis sp.]|uniref:hypothetical protein n=1 Tax=Chroococcidiopsis sp. TaxID=3088168 RepID=UPI003F2CA4AB
MIQSGDVFGKLTAIRFVEMKPHAKWEFNCGHCQSNFITFLNSVKRGHTKSCGCLVRSQNGLSQTKEFKIWDMMKRRCNDPKNKSFNDYGGRGIKVCDSWLESFEIFLKDMGEAPTKEHSLDRINVNGDYCPENCKWSTRTEQNRNRRDSIYLTLNGKTEHIAQWAFELGIDYFTLMGRYKKGWSHEDILTKPLREIKYTKNSVVEYNGETKTIEEWAKLKGVNTRIILRRLSENGWSVEKAIETKIDKSNPAYLPQTEIKPITYNGETKTWQQWADACNIPRRIFRRRLLEQKWNPAVAIETPYKKRG